MDELKTKIGRLSCRLNDKLKYGIKNEDYEEILDLSQELDKLILIYTKLTLQVK